MLSFYQEARRLEALQRIEAKRLAAASPPEEEEAVSEPKRLGRPIGSTKPKTSKTPKQPKVKTPKELEPSLPKNSKQVTKNCEICGTEFSTQLSWAPRKHTCGNRICSSIKRSLSLRKSERWLQPKTREGVNCCNFLEPDRRRSRQIRFCSIRCSRNSRSVKTLTEN